MNLWDKFNGIIPFTSYASRFRRPTPSHALLPSDVVRSNAGTAWCGNEAGHSFRGRNDCNACNVFSIVIYHSYSLHSVLSLVKARLDSIMQSRGCTRECVESLDLAGKFQCYGNRPADVTGIVISALLLTDKVRRNDSIAANVVQSAR